MTASTAEKVNAPEGRARDRLQPVLLDRLTDQAPQQARERAGAFLMNDRLLRDSVLRDLQWLLNTSNLGAAHPAHRMRRVRGSVVNYGMCGWGGQRMSEIDQDEVEAAIRTAILDFEPRIMREGLEVHCISEAADLEHHNLLTLQIRGTLWSVPYPIEFILRSELDLESGHVVLHPEGGL